MQGGLSATDRKLLTAAAALAFAMVVLTIAFAPAREGGESKVPSTYSSASGGARAAYLLLQGLHYPVQRWEQAPTQLPTTNQRAVLIIAGPTESPTRAERESLLRFVRAGGRIVFCGELINSFFPQTAVTETSAGEEWREFEGDLPSPFTRDARRITMEPSSTWKSLNWEQLALYGDERNPVAILWQIGRGQLIWWCAPTLLTNAGISRTRNLNLFLNAVSGPQGQDPLPIYWDEYFHGIRTSLWSYVEKTPVKWALLQVLIIFGAVMFSFSRRWGPIAIPCSVSRLSPLEFVDTLGGLYERARASSVVTSVAYRHLRLGLTRRLSLPPAASDFTIAQAARDRLGWDQARLAATLEKAANTQSQNTPPADALKVAQEIGAYTALLTNTRLRQERH